MIAEILTDVSGHFNAKNTFNAIYNTDLVGMGSCNLLIAGTDRHNTVTAILCMNV